MWSPEPDQNLHCTFFLNDINYPTLVSSLKVAILRRQPDTNYTQSKIKSPQTVPLVSCPQKSAGYQLHPIKAQVSLDCPFSQLSSEVSRLPITLDQSPILLRLSIQLVVLRSQPVTNYTRSKLSLLRLSLYLVVLRRQPVTNYTQSQLTSPQTVPLGSNSQKAAGYQLHPIIA